MAYEPRPVPYYPDVLNDQWYCLDCSSTTKGRFAMSNHWITTHGEQGENPCDGVDIAVGSQLLLMRARRLRFIEQQAEEFASQMHDGFGPDDFVNEAIIGDA